MTKKVVKIVGLVEVFVQALLSALMNAEAGVLTMVITFIITAGLCFIFYAILKKKIDTNKHSIGYGVFYLIMVGRITGILYIIWQKSGVDAKEEVVEEAKTQEGEQGHQKVPAYCPYCSAPVESGAHHCDKCGNDF